MERPRFSVPVTVSRCCWTLSIEDPFKLKALKSLDILQMPGRSSLKAILSSNTQKPGVSLNYLCEQNKCYDQHCDQSRKPKPVGEGVLVFDEVKVQNGVRRMLYIYCMYIENRPGHNSVYMTCVPQVFTFC